MDPIDLPNEPSAADLAAEQTAGEEAFAQAFSESAHDPLPGEVPRDEVVEQVAATPAAPASAPAADDPFASLPPAMKELLAKIPTLEHDQKTANGRLSALQRENEALKRQLSQAPAAAPPAPAPAEPAELPSVKAVRDQGLPEVADAINEALKSRKEPAAAPAPAAPAPAAVVEVDDPRLAQEADALQKLQPEWAQKMNSADFKLYLGMQDEATRTNVLTTDRAIVVLAALTQFDQHQAAVRTQVDQAAQLADKRRARSSDAIAPKSGAPAPPRKGEPTEEEAFLLGFNEGRSP